MKVERPNRVWPCDIIDIQMARCFVYLVAVVDWFNPRVLSHRVSIVLRLKPRMETDFCVEVLEEIFGEHSK